MKGKFRLVVAIFLFLFSFSLLAEPKMVVMPVGAKSTQEKKLSSKIDNSFKKSYSSLDGVKAVAYTSKMSKSTARKVKACEKQMTCYADYGKKLNGIEYILASEIAVKGKKAQIKYYLIESSNGKVKGKSAVVFGTTEDAYDVSEKIVAKVNSMISKSVSSSSSRSSSSVTRSSYYGNSEENIKTALSYYKEGDLSGAKKILKEVAKKENDKNAAKLYKAVENVESEVSKLKMLMKKQQYSKAAQLLDRIESLDEGIRKMGTKYDSFMEVEVSRLVYAKSETSDAKKSMSIHNKYKSKQADLRKWRVDELAKVDKWLNDRINDRIKQAKSEKEFETEKATQENQAKKELVERISKKKAEWQKADIDLGQQIEEIEGQLTMIEQQEKGIVRVTDKDKVKRDKDQERELKIAENEYNKKTEEIRKEKEEYYKNNDEKTKKEADDLTAKIKKLEETKAAKEEEIKTIREKLEKLALEFEQKEREYTSGNESTKMQSEDEDRKYAVEIQKEYQVAFDKLNAGLADYDRQDSEWQKKLSAYDKEIEEFMLQKADELGKVQADIETKRTTNDKSYKEKKENAQVAVEKEYQQKLEDLKKKKADMEKAITDSATKLEEAKKVEQMKVDEEKAKIEKDLSAKEAELSAFDTETERLISEQEKSLSSGAVDYSEADKLAEKRASEKTQKEAELDTVIKAAQDKLTAFDTELNGITDQAAKDAKAPERKAIEDEVASAEKKKSDEIAAFDAETDKMITAKKAEIDNQFKTASQNAGKAAEELKAKRDKERKALESTISDLSISLKVYDKTSERKLKSVFASLDKNNKKELDNLNKELKKITKELEAHESNHDAIVQEKIMNIDADYEKQSMEYDMTISTTSDKLNKEIKDYKAKKLEEKKKAEKEYQVFLKKKADYKKDIEKKVEAEQKKRDDKLAKRKDSREKTSGIWDKDAERRKQAFERSISFDKKKMERLSAEIDDITKKMEATNSDYAMKAEDKKIAFSNDSVKKEKAWKEKLEKLETDYKAKKEKIEDKYAKMELASKAEKTDNKKSLEDKREALITKKDKAKEELQEWLTAEKEKWDSLQEEWKADKERRLDSYKENAVQRKQQDEEDKDSAKEKKSDVERNFNDKSKELVETELDDIRSAFNEESDTKRVREMEASAITTDIDSYKAEIYANTGLDLLNAKKYIEAKENFAKALYADRNNSKAQAGMQSINDTAKTMYWNGFGMRETNKSEAKKIFVTLIKLLYPSNEIYVKALIALDELN